MWQGLVLAWGYSWGQASSLLMHLEIQLTVIGGTNEGTHLDKLGMQNAWGSVTVNWHCSVVQTIGNIKLLRGGESRLDACSIWTWMACSPTAPCRRCSFIYLVLERWLCTSLVTNISVAMLDNRYACCTVSIQNANILEWQNSNGTQRRSWFWHYWIVLELLPDEDTYIKASVHWRKSEKLQHITQAISPQVMSLSVTYNSCFTRSKFALTLHWQWWITSGQSGSVD